MHKAPTFVCSRKSHSRQPDENQQALKDPLLVPVRPITRARFKKIKEALNGPILT